MVPGGQSTFGVGPMSQISGFPAAGSAAGFDMLGVLASAGIGRIGQGIGINDFIGNNFAIGGEAAPIAGFTVAGSATALGAAGNLAGAGAGFGAAAGFGRSSVLSVAGLVSGIGGILTSLTPLLGNKANAILAGADMLSGVAGALLSSYQHVSNRVLNNADIILSTKIANLETVSKQLGAQEEVIKKLLKDGIEGDKKTIQDL